MSRILQEHDERAPLLGDPAASIAQETTARNIALEAEENEAIVQASSTTTRARASRESINDVPASWLTLPNKRQLILLALCRFVEPVSQTSIHPYMYYFLHSLDPSLPPATIVRRAGYLASAFATCMFLTGWFWGRTADKIGRKKVILIGLTSTSIASIIYGFSESYSGLVFARCFAGLMDGNIAILRTMITENVLDKKYHSRAFLILPLTFNFGSILGPLLGGVLADPAGEGSPMRKVFGPGSFFGGKNGVGWMRRWKYALPNVVSATLLFTIAAICFLFLEETLETRKKEKDIGIYIGNKLKRLFLPSRYKQDVISPQGSHIGAETANQLLNTEDSINRGQNNPEVVVEQTARAHIPTKIWTRNVKLTILSCAILPLHMSTFMHLWSPFLSAPRSDGPRHLPFQFNGGLGLRPLDIAFTFSLFGSLGVLVQILTYPPVVQYMGILSAYRWSLSTFPLAYFLLPYLSTLPSTTPPPGPATGPAIWTGIAVIMLLQVTARTFSLPSSVILLTNSAPSSLVLGRIHGLTASLASFSKAVGPAVAGILLGVGLEAGFVGIVWWTLAGVSVVGAIVGLWLREGGGIGDTERGGGRIRL